jgi:hypothetical protein
VATDDLYSPLGLGKKPARFRLPPVVLRVAAGALGIGLATFAIWMMVRNDPFGGEPMAVAKADLGVADAGVAAKLRPSQPDAAAPENTGSISPAEEIAQLEKREQAGEAIQDRAAAGRGEQIVTIIDGRSGARQEVKIPAPTGLGIAPALDGGIVEMTRDGPIPRVGANGMRAATAYAQPSGAKPNAPQIAIVITGIGTSNATATEAINKLPAAVTLAFAPGGGDLERLAGKARSLGHELLLQVPMEPTESAEQNPAPQALLTSLPPDRNIERLHWLMSRFQGMSASPAGQVAAPPPRKRRLRRSCVRSPIGGLFTWMTAAPALPRPIWCWTRCRRRPKSTGRWRSSKVSRARTVRPSASPRHRRW